MSIAESRTTQSRTATAITSDRGSTILSVGSLRPSTRAHETRLALQANDPTRAATLLLEAHDSADYWQLGCPSWTAYLDAVCIVSRRHAQRLIAQLPTRSAGGG